MIVKDLLEVRRKYYQRKISIGKEVKLKQKKIYVRNVLKQELKNKRNH